eukprot:bmy_10705T0
MGEESGAHHPPVRCQRPRGSCPQPPARHGDTGLLSPASLAVSHPCPGPGSISQTRTVLPSWGCSSSAKSASAFGAHVLLWVWLCPPTEASRCRLLRTACRAGSRGLCRFPRGWPRSWGRRIPGTAGSFGQGRGQQIQGWGSGQLGALHNLRGLYKGLVTGARARGVIAVLWVLAFGIGLTPFLGWNSKDSATNCTEPWDGTTNASCCLVKCLFENVVPMSYMVYFNFFGCVLPPLLIMLVIYVKIFLVACRQLQRMELMDHSRTILQREIHAAKSLAVIVGIFALCWLPVHAINCVTLFQPAWAKEKPKWAMNTAILLSHANSVVNPIVYAYRNRDFRYTFHQIISRYVLCRTDVRKSGDGQAGAQPALQVGL